MAPQYFTVFPLYGVPPNPGIYSVSNVWSPPPQSRNLWYFQSTEYFDRVGAEPLKRIFLPQKYTKGIFRNSFSEFRTQSRNEQAQREPGWEVAMGFGYCGTDSGTDFPERQGSFSLSQNVSGKKKAHQLLTHILFEKAVNPGTTSRLTRRNCLFSWFRRRTHNLFCLVNRPVVPGSTGPRPEQKVYVYLPFSLPRKIPSQIYATPNPKVHANCG